MHKTQLETVMDKFGWLDGLQAGLPSQFDYGVLRSPDDAAHLIYRLPNRDRGIAAKAMVEHLHVIGRETAYRGLLVAWEHDHGHVLNAFGEDPAALTAAFRAVSLPSMRTSPVRAWRGSDHLDGWYGPSWTLDRDCACWFALRFGSTPFVFVCDLPPAVIITEHYARNEQELIVDMDALLFLEPSLDEGDEVFRDPLDLRAFEDVTASAVQDWERGKSRWMSRL